MEKQMVHKDLVAGVNKIAPALAMAGKNWKALKMPPGVLGTINSFPKLAAWFTAHPEPLPAPEPAAKAKTQRAGG